DELVKYMKDPERLLESEPPEVEDYEGFFAGKLKKAHHIIHIAITASMSDEYNRTSQAAKSFDNVTVVDAECLSSAAGILVLLAYQMAKQNIAVEDILEELESAKKRINCGFILASIENMNRRGFISNGISTVLNNLNLSMALKISDNRYFVDGIYGGSRRRRYERYIDRTLKHMKPDRDLLFITYVDMDEKELEWIEEEVKKRVIFHNIIFKKASAAISLNAGSGCFGLIYMGKDGPSYNLSSLFPMLKEGDAVVNVEYESRKRKFEERKRLQALMEDEDGNKDAGENDSNRKWYEGIDGIDYKAAIKNSGSEEAFKSVLKIFYDSIDQKSGELKQYRDSEDWENYTIKVHALKSSAKLVGAIALSDDALALEQAGKAGDIDYIIKNHPALMEEYIAYKTALAEVFKTEETDGKGQIGKAVDAGFLKEVYEAIKEGAEAMDCDMIEEALARLEGYDIPEGELKKIEAIKAAYDEFDYDRIQSIIEE
ncbi:MAG: DegV family EDD domain-containing protein, partial [Lachnospiraceae bacterium]|nr:DegV family EDD domain-containing protein [Lachnospiraceae bacterium]